jgi:hypothetical protein
MVVAVTGNVPAMINLKIGYENKHQLLVELSKPATNWFWGFNR